MFNLHLLFFQGHGGFGGFGGRGGEKERTNNINMNEAIFILI